MDATAAGQFVEDLKGQRRSVLSGILMSRTGYDQDAVRKLAEIQSAIAAVEAEMAESEVSGSSWEEPSTTD